MGEAAAKDVTAAWFMSTPFEAGEEAETKQGMAVVDADGLVGRILHASATSSRQKRKSASGW